MRQKEKEMVLTWLSSCRAKLHESASAVLDKVRGLLFSPESRRSSMVKIKEALRPSVRALLQRLSENSLGINRRREHDKDMNVR